MEYKKSSGGYYRGNVGNFRTQGEGGYFVPNNGVGEFFIL